MGDVINLRRARKAKARDGAAAKAASHRALHGRTAAEKSRDRIEAERLARAVDGAKRDREGESETEAE